MKVYTLLENDSNKKGLKSAHGLSLYIDFNGTNILFDLGPGKQYIHNAEKLGLDLKEVDILVISHGHFDHGKRIDSFLKLNKKAKVYISKHAFEGHYKRIGKAHIPIGIPKIPLSERIVLLEEDIEIQEGIKLYINIEMKPLIIGDTSLEKRIDKEFMVDDFNHEIYMVLEAKENNVLFSGCSHKGIENIIHSIEEKQQKKFTTVIGGFHFSHFDETNDTQYSYLLDLSNQFKSNTNTVYYTGHCTGTKAYTVMKNVMEDNLKRIKSGVIFEV